MSSAYELSPSDVLRMQVDFVTDLSLPDSMTAGALDGLAYSQHRQDKEDTVSSAYTRAHASHARAYHVTTDMARVVMNRAASVKHIPPTTHCPADIGPPRPAGFVVMETPIPYRDIRGSLNLMHVLVWGPGTANVSRSSSYQVTGSAIPGWVLSAWNDVRREPDEVALGLIRENPGYRQLREMRWWPCTTLFLPRNQRLGDPTWPVTDEDRARADQEAVEEAFRGLPAVAETVPNLVRTWVALWQLFGEERGPALAEDARPQRPALRMARRVLHTSDITVTTLRRRPAKATGTGTPLDHQVPVGEHPRTYWCTGRSCTCDVRVEERHPEKRMIREFIRGPKGTPLIVRKKMERLSR